MANLQVLNAPTNQPVLNPKVQSAPVQPALAPKVVTAPAQSRMIPKVVTQPTQPQLNPEVQTQPQGLGTINSTGTATEQKPYTQKLSMAEFGQMIKQKYPAYTDKTDIEVAQAVIAKYPQYSNKVNLAQLTPKTEPEGVYGLAGFGLGAVKGALNTFKNTSELLGYIGSKIPQSIKDTTTNIFPSSTLPFKAITYLGDKVNKENIQPEGTAEKIGFGTEQIAEFFIPGGAVSKAGKVAEAGIDTLKLANKFGKAGKVAETLLNYGSKAGLGAAESAGVTALQGGSESDIKTAGVLGGAFSIVSRGISKILDKAPQTAWSSILKRTPTEAIKNPDLPAEAAKTGLVGFSREAIVKKSQQAIQSIEVALDDILSSSKEKISTLKIAPYLDELRNAYKNIPGEKSSVDTINSVMEDLLKKKSLTVLEANKLKRDIYGAISKSYGKGMLEVAAKTESQKLIAAGLKREIEKVIPEAKNLNEQQAVYIQIRKALEKTIARTEGKGIAGTGVGLYDLLVGGIGTVAGAATANPLLGLGLVAGKKALESSAVLSATSKLLNYFNSLSPTKKLLFYNAIKGLTTKAGVNLESN